jgi:hypothetical protein
MAQESIQINLSTIFSQLKEYRWNFSLGYNPTSISCISVSETTARESIMKFLTDIDTVSAEYRKAYAAGDYENARKLRYELYNNPVDATLNIGCYTKGLYDYHLKMKIGYGDGDGDEKTLEEFIMTTSPRVFDFKPISVFSCLDG